MSLKDYLNDIKATGLTDTAIAQYIGVSTQTIRNIRAGETNILYETGVKVEKMAAASRDFMAVINKL